MNEPIHLVSSESNDTGPFVAKSTSTDQPERIGRYRVEKVLGQGGFGVVYLAHDDQLQRLVAIKVPHRKLVERLEDAEAYLTEARTVANLDHPNIVPVHDVGSTEGCPCYVVSKYVDGTDLASRLKRSRLPIHDAVKLVATVAEALHHAHRQGLVHRDIKPGNILLDKSGKPFVADFGLALREQDVGKGPRCAGTPAYMSPEQARGEGHRVDGRSDIFSLGVVFYELLVGRQPFRADSQSDLMEQVTSFEARPPRQYDDHIPKELDRICLKALSKRASERYSAAKDMADDLRHFLAEQTVNQQSSPDAKGIGSRPVTAVTPPPSTSTASNRSSTFSTTPSTPTPDHLPVKIVPKGLRSFDAHDADFFLELLPGPRDRDGLPDSIRFWKTRIEEMDADSIFSVGLIYGPSGCGKSSLVKAGLLPRLSEDVIAVYVEVTAGDTETRLLNGLRKRCPALPDKLLLKETLAALRRGQGIPVGKKVVIVLDQFEQWLHAKKEEQNTELVQALRQCDGGRVQCVVMVRDDFWMAATRFMRELEVRLVEGQNSAAVDLFPIRHAEKVLAAFGRAFGVLPDASTDASKDQKEFLTQSVAGLAQEGKVICVRLALFAEMMKGKAWTPATLREAGGTEGVGATFLEETFSAANAPPEHRYHQKAARAVLKALLPESGTDIKGQMKSYDELLAASAYAGRPKDFDDLIRILDSEIRLITPTDPEGKQEADHSTVKTGEKNYQLTHDYLVHSLRDWLTRKQKETRRGRAELLLADRAGVWNARPENRQLPSLLQSFQIKWLTQKKNWTLSQRKMMAKAGRLHANHSLIAALLLVALVVGGREIYGRIEAKALVEQLTAADITEVPKIVEKLASYRRWADPLLRQEDAQEKEGSKQKLHTALALLTVDESKLNYLRDQLLVVTPTQFPVVRNALLSHKDAIVEPLWSAALDSKRETQQRFQAACALATFDPESQRWAKVQNEIADDLVALPAVYLATWMDALHPVRGKLLAPLSVVFRDAKRKETERSLATDILADYAADQPQVLADLLADSEEFQFPVIFAKLAAHQTQAIPLAEAELAKRAGEKASEDEKERLAKRQANLAVALLRWGNTDKVWRLLQFSPDPRARSYFIHWISPLGGDSQTIINRLDIEPDVTIRRALVLMLGEFTDSQLPITQRQPLIERLLAVYENEPDAGLHGAAEWLLRKWGESNGVRTVVEKLCSKEEQLQARKATDKRQWYVNTQSQTFVILDAGGFLMGSPESEARRFRDETQHHCRIGRRFAISTMDVTKAQFARFQTAHPEVRKMNTDQWVKTDDSPPVDMTWYEAAQYCNWLSEREGIEEKQWCYEPNEKGKYGPGMKARDKYLELSGYRLPTEAEWEYACRAGTVTSRYYGLSDTLLGQYAWYEANAQNRTWPVGSLKPNDFGLFDMQGNAFNWCDDLYQDYPAVADTSEDLGSTKPVIDTVDRLMRGGAYGDQPRSVRSASRFGLQPLNRYLNLSFRPARTCP